MSRLRLLDIFSGIGGFSLGLERSGAFETVAFCEFDPKSNKPHAEQHNVRVLKRHWPEIPVFSDVRTLDPDALRPLRIDAICGGFPCQDISFAGRGAGLDGERSGLWREYARCVRYLRPRFVVVENVAALLGRGMGAVLGELSACGYDAVWRRIAAADVGAPHLRQRIWIVAYARGLEHESFGDALWRTWSEELAQPPADAEVVLGTEIERSEPDGAFARGRAMADTVGEPGRACGARDADEGARRRYACRGGLGADVSITQCDGFEGRHAEWRWPGSTLPSSWWSVEPDVGRVAHGVPARVDRLRALGNAVVPQIPELIGRAIARARTAA